MFHQSYYSLKQSGQTEYFRGKLNNLNITLFIELEYHNKTINGTKRLYVVKSFQFFKKETIKTSIIEKKRNTA